MRERSELKGLTGATRLLHSLEVFTDGPELVLHELITKRVRISARDLGLVPFQ